MFTASILGRLHTGVVVRYNLQRKVVMDGRMVARMYLFHGTMIADVASTLPSWLEVRCNREHLASFLAALRNPASGRQHCAVIVSSELSASVAVVVHDCMKMRSFLHRCSAVFASTSVVSKQMGAAWVVIAGSSLIARPHSSWAPGARRAARCCVCCWQCEACAWSALCSLCRCLYA